MNLAYITDIIILLLFGMNLLFLSLDALVKEQKYDGKEKSSSSRRANHEE